MSHLILLIFVITGYLSVLAVSDETSWPDYGDLGLPFNESEWGEQTSSSNKPSIDLSQSIGYSSVGDDVRPSESDAAKCDRRDLCSLSTLLGSDFNSFPLCQCDEKCVEHGDCCLETLNTTEHNSRQQLWQCLPLSIHEHQQSQEQIFVFMTETCPWGSDEILTTKCHRQDGPSHVYTHLMDIPVYSKTSRIIYPNIYCAQCNSDGGDLGSWNVTLRCDSESFRDNLSQLVSTGEARYVRGQRRWVLNGTSHECQMDIENFEIISRFVKDTKLRQCIQSIDYCPHDWTGSEDVKLKCSSYTSYVETAHHNRYRVFKNWHCAVCNGVPSNEIHCYGILFRDDLAPARQLLFNFTKIVDFKLECIKEKDAEFLFSKGCASVSSLNIAQLPTLDAVRQRDEKNYASCPFLSNIAYFSLVFCVFFLK